MKYAIQMGSGAMIYIPSFIKIGSGIQKLGYTDTQTEWRSHKPTLIFFLNNESRPMLGGSLVTTAWRVLRLRMEGTPSRYGG
jgi:hypothetical protein